MATCTRLICFQNILRNNLIFRPVAVISRALSRGVVSFRPYYSRHVLSNQTKPFCGQTSKGFGMSKFYLASLLTYLGLVKEHEKEDPLIHTMKLGILAMQRDQWDKAEQMLHLALKMAQDTLNEDGITYIYDLLANVALRKGEYDKAETLFVETMKRLITLNKMEKDDNSIVEISLKMASIYGFQGKLDMAEQGYQFCIDTQKRKLDEAKEKEISEDDLENMLALWAMCTDYYARFLMTQERFDDAAKKFQSALLVCQQINGETHPQTLVLLNDLGSVYSLNKDFDKAVEHLERAIMLGSHLLSLTGECDDLPSFYCNLATVRIEQGQLDKAKDACDEAVKLAKKLGNQEAESEARKCLEHLQKLAGITGATAYA